MANRTYEVLTADQMALTIFCGGQSNVGLGVSGTWVGSWAAFGSVDGINFFPIPMTPFPSGANVSSGTGNGNWFTPVKNLIAVKIVFTRTSGSMQVNLAAAIDSSWQDAFLTQANIFVSVQKDGGGTNTLTQAAQANRAWNLTFCEVSLNGPQAQGQISVAIFDGIGGTILFKDFVPTGGGSVGYTYELNLPKDAQGNKTLVGTPGNAMVIQVTGAGGSSIINTRFSAA